MNLKKAANRYTFLVWAARYLVDGSNEDEKERGQTVSKDAIQVICKCLLAFR